jgi:hypothetical protein
MRRKLVVEIAWGLFFMNTRIYGMAFAVAAILAGSAAGMVAFAAAPAIPGGPYGPGAGGIYVPDNRYGAPDDRYGPNSYPVVPQQPAYGARPEQRYDERGFPLGEEDSVLSIDSKNSCKLFPANNTVAARGECTMNKSCIVQQRRARTEAQWRDSIGNPTPREQGEEYRPFCR